MAKLTLIESHKPAVFFRVRMRVRGGGRKKMFTSGDNNNNNSTISVSNENVISAQPQCGAGVQIVVSSYLG